MSHVSRVDIIINDLDCLVKACKDLGFELRESKTYRWYGRWVGDTPLPPGATVEDLGKCDYEIVVPGARYSIGVKKIGKGYVMEYDYWSPGGLPQTLGKQIKTHYNKHKVTKEAKKRGWRIREEKTNGKIKLRLSKY